MSDKDKLRVGIIGLGYWGPNLVRNFYHNRFCKVSAVCDINQERLKAIAQKYKDIDIFTTDYKELTKLNLDIVAISTPPETHYQLAKEFLYANKNILVEKPFTLNSIEAEQLINIAEKKKLKIFVDHTFVFHPVVRKIKQILDENLIGKIYYFDSERINLGLLQTKVNVIWDLAVHDLSIISFLFPKIKTFIVRAYASRHVHPYLEDIAHIVIESDNGFISHIHVSWLSPVKIRKTIIGGSERMIWWDDVHPFEKLKIYESKIEIDLKSEDPFFPRYVKGDIKVIAVENYESLAKEVEEIVTSIFEDKKPTVDGYEGMKIVKILEACNESMKRGKEIKLTF